MRGNVCTCLIVLLLIFTVMFSVNARGEPVNRDQRLLLNGELIATEISKATGCAISPILGISVLGAYTYYTTPVQDRSNVVWHARPLFWWPLLVVLLAIVLKDSAKIVLPKILIIPLDVIENQLEKNVSAVLGLLVILSSLTGRGLEQLKLSESLQVFFIPAAAIGADSLATGAYGPPAGLFELAALNLLVSVIFTLVWVFSQSFNLLILISPFSWLDLLLTMGKNFFITMLLGTYLLHSFLGLLLSSMVILLCLFLFARSFRFVIFGTIFALDILWKNQRKHKMETGQIRAFAGTAFAGVPSLSYGSLHAAGERLTFRYRPWLILPLRSVQIPHVPAACEVGGTLSPSIITVEKQFHADLTFFRLRPLDGGSRTESIAQILGLKGVRDVLVGKSVRDGIRWLTVLFGLTQYAQTDW